jgi:pimeloyl-ACP methyl ester carboxylesterase
MKRLGIAGVSIAIAVAGLATTAQGANAASSRSQSDRAPAATAYTPPPLTWHKCDSPTLRSFGSQCADLVVPVDYDKPNGKKITLAVSRLKHSSPVSRYQGVMLVNPGGPGSSGLVYSIFGEGSFVPGDGDTTYDWIGFDPRGVGSSEPALTCDPSFYGYDRPPFDVTRYHTQRTWLRRSAHYANACAQSAAGRIGLLDHMRTTDNVMDMESLRKALGQKTINFYGFSYGTELGQVYATLHPNRVRRFVLDSNVDPSRTPYQANLDQDVAFQKTVNVYFGWLADHDSVYHLGTTRQEVARGFYAERRKLDQHAAGGIVGGDELTDALVGAAYWVYDWVDIAEAYSALVDQGRYQPIADVYGATPDVPGSDNGDAVYLATTCTDGPWPSWQRVERDNIRVDREAPFITWDNVWVNGPCLFWPAKAGTPVDVTGKNVKRPILLIDETFDPATPYAGSLEVRRRFPTASLIEGVGGTTHAGSLSGVACTDNAIGRYLSDGTVPERKAGNRSDLRCPPVPQPEPEASSGQSLQKQAAPAAAGLPPLLRDRLMAAQRR